jgi:hypothetical protein
MSAGIRPTSGDENQDVAGPEESVVYGDDFGVMLMQPASAADTTS